MRHLYIDLTGASKKANANFHGGGNYARLLAKHLIKNSSDWDIKILMPKSYETRTTEDEEFLSVNQEKIYYIDSILSFDFPSESRVFIPMISNVGLNVLKKLKRKNLELFVTIHGIRNIDLRHCDKYEKYYYSGFLKTNDVYVTIRKQVKYHLTKFNLKKYLNYADYILTDSNYSLENITKYAKVNQINYFHPTIPELSYKNDSNQKKYEAKFILFVSGNRVEKNFIRSLVAFQQFKKEHPNNSTKLFSTGVNDDFWTKLKSVRGIDKEFLENHVEFLGYVSNEELSSLYQNCKYLLYTSLSEGYGLPVLEATKFNKQVICPFGTSVPEVIGSNAVYVNPYSVDSIKNGIKIFEQKDLNQNNSGLLELVNLRNKIETANQIEYILRRDL